MLAWRVASVQPADVVLALAFFQDWRKHWRGVALFAFVGVRELEPSSLQAPRYLHGVEV